MLQYVHFHNSEHIVVVGETVLKCMAKDTAISKTIVHPQKQCKIG